MIRIFNSICLKMYIYIRESDLTNHFGEVTQLLLQRRRLQIKNYALIFFSNQTIYYRYIPFYFYKYVVGKTFLYYNILPFDKLLLGDSCEIVKLLNDFLLLRKNVVLLLVLYYLGWKWLFLQLCMVLLCRETTHCCNFIKKRFSWLLNSHIDL